VLVKPIGHSYYVRYNVIPDPAFLNRPIHVRAIGQVSVEISPGKGDYTSPAKTLVIYAAG
jgi:hypothetical protein